MPAITGVLSWGQQKKADSGAGSGTSTGSTGGTDSSGGTGSTGGTETTTPPPATQPTTETTPSQPTTAPAAPALAPAVTSTGSADASQPSYAYSGTINQVSAMPPSLRELLAQDAAVTVTPLGQLADALRAANEQLDLLEPVAPELLYRTAAEIIAQASTAIVAQATHSEQSVMAVLKHQM